MKRNLSFIFVLALMGCNTEKVENPLEYIPQKIPGVCEENFAPIPVTRTDLTPRPNGLAGLPKGTYTLLNSEFFIQVSGGEVPAITYATHILDGSTPSYTSCTRGVRDDTPTVFAMYDAVKSYTYDNTPQQTYTPIRYTLKFGPNLPAELTAIDLTPITGVIAMPGGYTSINVYELAGSKFEIRAIKGMNIGGKAVGLNILQRFSFVAAP